MSRIGRIALVTERFPPDPGGLSASVARLARGLAARGERVDVFRLSARLAPGVRDRESLDRISVHHLGPHRKVEDTLADWIAHLEAEHARTPFAILHAYYVTRPGFVAAHVGLGGEMPLFYPHTHDTFSMADSLNSVPDTSLALSLISKTKKRKLERQKSADDLIHAAFSAAGLPLHSNVEGPLQPSP